MSGVRINWQEKLMPYEQAVRELVVKFNSLAEGFARLGKPSPIESVNGRVKSVSSILAKARRKGITLDQIEDKLEDIAGVRVLCRFREDIAKVRELVAERDKQDMEVYGVRDYVANRKPSGYQSLHIIIAYPVVTAEGKKVVRAEIQIRTLAMNFWATLEHSLRYKYEKQIPEYIQKRLLNSADAAYDMDKQFSLIRDDILDAENEQTRFSRLADEVMELAGLLNTQDLYDEVAQLTRDFERFHQAADVSKLTDMRDRLLNLAEVRAPHLLNRKTRVQ